MKQKKEEKSKKEIDMYIRTKTSMTMKQFHFSYKHTCSD